MSQIDQAFIKAYTSDTSVGVPWESPLPTAIPVGLSDRPLRLHQQPSATDWPKGYETPLDPVPAPHFSVAGPEDPYSISIATQPTSFPTQPQREAPPAPRVPAVEPTQERRPLSSFAVPQTPPLHAFRPVFEVDSFRWPALIDQVLSTSGYLLRPVAEQLLDASEQGRSMVGIAGARPGVGTTTIQLCLARLIASTGKSVVIVDGDFTNRSLARELGLEFDTGWENVLTGQMPLAECVVQAIADRIALLPLVGHPTPPSELLASIQTSISAGVLRYHYDLVLFDLGAAGREPQYSTARSIIQDCRIDASIIVADSRTVDASQEQVDSLMSLLGPSCLGLIGNQAL